MRPHFMKEILILTASLPLIALMACGGSTPPSTTTYTIGGTVSGLGTGASVGLLDNGGDALTVTANGAFTFATPLVSGAGYAVTVGTQPAGQTCTVSGGSGTVGTANVTSVIVSCAANKYTIGGTISGLASSSSIVLLDNGGDALTETANGAFTFATSLENGSGYAVTVGTQPTGQTCAVINGSGTVGSSNVTNVTVTCTAIATYSITVQITNLVGTIGVTLNGSTSASVTNPTATPASESIIFPKIANGTMYDVTVTTQPAGYTCATSDGSGTIASANVTVNVACTANGSGSGGFWIPYSATPVSSTKGQSGLFVIASNSIDSTPAPTPTFVTTSVPTLLGAAYQGFVSGSAPPTSVTPDLIMYAAVGSDGNTHVYGLNLTDASTPPVPVQITNLSVPPSEHICYEGQVQSDLTTPSSLAVVMYVTAGVAGAQPGTVGYCGSNPGTFELAHYTDGPTVTPLTLNIPGASTLLSALENDIGFTPLYQTNGQLGGIVLWDASTGNYLFYSDATFTSSTTLLSNVSIGIPCVNTSAIGNGVFNGNSLLLSVSTASGTAAYRITASGGTPQQFFAGIAGSCVSDDKNLYFIGTPSGTATSAIYQEPLPATAPAQMLVSLPTASDTSGSNLIGSNGSILLFQNYSETLGSITSSVFSVPVGVPSKSATAVGGPIAGTLSTTFLASPTSSPAGDLLFLTATDVTSSGISYSSQVLTTGGTVEEVLPDAVFGAFGGFTTELNGNILEIHGITDTKGGYGGATVDLASVSTLDDPIPFTIPSGGDYLVPAGDLMGLEEFPGTGIGTGFLFSAANPTNPYTGVAVDVSKHVILPITLTNSSILALF